MQAGSRETPVYYDARFVSLSTIGKGSEVLGEFVIDPDYPTGCADYSNLSPVAGEHDAGLQEMNMKLGDRNYCQDGDEISDEFCNPETNMFLDGFDW